MEPAREANLASILVSFVPLIGLISACSWSTPDLNPELSGETESSLSELLSWDHEHHRALSGVARLEAQMICSGFLHGSLQHPQAPAYFISSGHCVQDWQNFHESYFPQGERSLDKAWTVIFKLFHDRPSEQLRVPVKKLLFTTMGRVDIAVLELEQTMGGLAAAGILPLSLAAKAPEPGAPIEIVGLPEPGEGGGSAVLRRQLCREGQRQDVIESHWFWPQLHSNRCADIGGGSSGSPLLNAERQAFALVSTTSRRARGEPCLLGHPCVRGEKGFGSLPDTNFAMSLEVLRACWNERGLFQPQLSGCALPSAPSFRITRGIPATVRSLKDRGLRASWRLALEGKAKVSFIQGRAGSIDCDDQDAYPPPQSIAQLKFGFLPLEEGPAWLCLREAEGKDPTVLVTLIDNSPPTQVPRLQIDTFPEGVQVFLLPEPPHIVSFQVAWGPPGEKRESTIKRADTRSSLSFERRELPIKLHYRAEDEAGNVGSWHEVLIPKSPQEKKRKQPKKARDHAPRVL